MQLEAGHSFSRSLAYHPECFSGEFVSLVRAAERTGTLHKTLNHLARNLAEREKRKSAIRATLLYPAIVLSINLLLMMALTLWVVPKFADFLAQAGGELPLATQLLVKLTRIATNPGVWLLVAVSLTHLYLLGRQWLSIPSESTRFYRRLHALPWVGHLLRLEGEARFSTALAGLIQAGVQLLEALPLALEATENPLLSSQAAPISARLKDGASLSTALGDTGVFRPLLYEMTRLGEETGRMAMSFEQAAWFAAQELEHLLELMISLLEPVLLGLLSLLMAGLMLSVFLPIYQMFSQL